MKRVIWNRMRTQSQEHLIFSGYRWLTWFLAVFTLPYQTSVDHPLIVWLLALACALNVVATTLSQGYVSIAQRRPILLIPDIFVGLAFVWMSGGAVWPFFPYALSSLILPGILLHGRGALIAALSFSVFDLGMFIAINAGGPNTSVFVILIRTLIPLALVIMLATLTRLIKRGLRLSALTAIHPANPIEHPPGGRLPTDLQMRPAQRFIKADDVSESTTPQVLTQTPVITHLPVIRPINQASHELRQSILQMTPHFEAELSVTLDQLVGNFSRSSGINTKLTLTGKIQQLTAAQQSTLLRLAQEALLNIKQHAQAHAASLTLCYESHMITLCVEDDGVGLLDGTYHRPGVHALRAMHYRLSELDGRLEVFEGGKGGVIVRGTLPLNEE